MTALSTQVREVTKMFEHSIKSMEHSLVCIEKEEARPGCGERAMRSKQRYIDWHMRQSELENKRMKIYKSILDSLAVAAEQHHKIKAYERLCANLWLSKEKNRVAIKKNN